MNIVTEENKIGKIKILLHHSILGTPDYSWDYWKK